MLVEPSLAACEVEHRLELVVPRRLRHAPRAIRRHGVDRDPGDRSPSRRPAAASTSAPNTIASSSPPVTATWKRFVSPGSSSVTTGGIVARSTWTNIDPERTPTLAPCSGPTQRRSKARSRSSPARRKGSARRRRSPSPSSAPTLRCCDRDADGLDATADRGRSERTAMRHRRARRTGHRRSRRVDRRGRHRRSGRRTSSSTTPAAGSTRAFLDVSAKGQASLIDENFTSVTNFVRACVPLMTEGGSIVNVTSIEASPRRAGLRRVRRDEGRGREPHQDARARARDASRSASTSSPPMRSRRPATRTSPRR